MSPTPGGGRRPGTPASGWCSRPDRIRAPREATAGRSPPRGGRVQLVTEDNITGLAVERWATAQDPRPGRAHDRAGAAPARLRPRGPADRGRVDGRDPVADPHRADQRREAGGVHPHLRRPRAVDARRPDEPPARPGGDAGHGARPVPHRGFPRARLRRGHVRGAGGLPLYLTARCATSTANPIRRAVLDVWQADAEGAYEAQLAEVDEARLRASTRPGRTAATACARSRRGLHDPDGRAGRRTDLATAISHSGRRTSTSCSPSPGSSR